MNILPFSLDFEGRLELERLLEPNGQDITFRGHVMTRHEVSLPEGCAVSY